MFSVLLNIGHGGNRYQFPSLPP